jgi:hypothetical protein
MKSKKKRSKRPRIITVSTELITVYSVRAGDEYSKSNPVLTFKRK